MVDDTQEVGDGAVSDKVGSKNLENMRFLKESWGNLDKSEENEMVIQDATDNDVSLYALNWLLLEKVRK